METRLKLTHRYSKNPIDYKINPHKDSIKNAQEHLRWNPSGFSRYYRNICEKKEIKDVKLLKKVLEKNLELWQYWAAKLFTKNFFKLRKLPDYLIQLLWKQIRELVYCWISDNINIYNLNQRTVSDAIETIFQKIPCLKCNNPLSGADEQSRDMKCNKCGTPIEIKLRRNLVINENNSINIDAGVIEGVYRWKKEDGYIIICSQHGLHYWSAKLVNCDFPEDVVKNYNDYLSTGVFRVLNTKRQAQLSINWDKRTKLESKLVQQRIQDLNSNLDKYVGIITHFLFQVEKDVIGKPIRNIKGRVKNALLEVLAILKQEPIPEKKDLCIFFKTKAGCRRGDKCTFLHEV